MEIEKNMYVRVKDNKGITYIRKIIDVADKTMKLYYYIAVDKDTRTTNYVSKKNVIKSSYNIIDLIELGDYVNGEKVIYIDDSEGCMREFCVSKESPEKDCGHWEEEIKSIVTHEQFKNMEYEVK